MTLILFDDFNVMRVILLVLFDISYFRVLIYRQINVLQIYKNANILITLYFHINRIYIILYWLFNNIKESKSY